MTHYQCTNCYKEGKTLEELRANGCNCRSEKLKMIDGNEEAEKIIDAAKKKQKEDDERSTSKKIYDFAMSRIKKIVIAENDSDGAYAIVENNSHLEPINLTSKRFRQWLRDLYSRNVESNDIHGDDVFKNVADEIIARAQMNGTARVRIYIRIAQLENQILYDLGTPDWKLIKITPDKIETVIFDTSLPVFQRRQSLQAQVIPKEGDGEELKRFAELLRISDDDKLVFIVHLICMFLESCPIPIMVFDGSAGSLKTTATAAIKMVVDPSGKKIEDNVSAMAEKDGDLGIQLNNRYLVSFDNVTSIDNDISDVLCRAVTGGSNTRRRKYSDDDEVIHSFKRKIVLNGIFPSLDYPDLQTRVLNYARNPVDDNNRITEQEFIEKLEQLLPGLLAKIFITLSKALKSYPDLKTKIRPKTRMADFEIWGEIISRVLGYDANSFLDSYHRKLTEGQISLIDSHPAVGLIQSLMENREQYENTISHLHQEITGIAVKSGIEINSKYIRFPKTPSYLKKELKIVEPLIKTIGFVVETYHYTKNDGRFTKNSSIVRISRRAVQSTLDVSEIASLASPMDILGTKTGEAIGEGTTNAPSPEKPEFTHKSDTGEASEGGEGIPETSHGRQFLCRTCNAGPWPVDAIGHNRTKIMDWHKGHEIEFMDQEQPKGENR
ncbi:MAG: hypothetical protein KGI27_11855 [Thaumarchaeota archaeon]|nr:hypothetical protein [Nitrososphaerota archaeon]